MAISGQSLRAVLVYTNAITWLFLVREESSNIVQGEDIRQWVVTMTCSIKVCASMKFSLLLTRLVARILSEDVLFGKGGPFNLGMWKQLRATPWWWDMSEASAFYWLKRCDSGAHDLLKSYQWRFVKFSFKMLIYIIILKHNIKMNLTA